MSSDCARAPKDNNNHLILICGKSTTGKSASLMNLKNQNRIVYLNCENGKELPFTSNMEELKVHDPFEVRDTIMDIKNHPDFDTIIVDSLTFMMDMYESKHVLTSSNTLKAWGDYAQFAKNLFFTDVAESDKSFIFTAHTSDIYNESEMVTETMVKVKGSLMNNGIEAFFTNVIACKKMPIGKLLAYSNPLLNFTEEEEILGYKYVYQTKLTKETVHERIRSPIGMWATNETYIDNNAQYVLDRLKEYYN